MNARSVHNAHECSEADAKPTRILVWVAPRPGIPRLSLRKSEGLFYIVISEMLGGSIVQRSDPGR
jgi:hypothetical protein